MWPDQAKAITYCCRNRAQGKSKRLQTSHLYNTCPIVQAAILRRPRRRHGVVSRYPSVRRDIAVVVQQYISAQAILDVLAEGMDSICTNITLFDVYHGEGLDSKEKSLAIGLTLQSQETTLGDEEINASAQAALALLEQNFGARLR